MHDDGLSSPLTPEILRRAHARRRVDLLRKALRERSLGPATVQSELDDWIDLFQESRDPALLVLLLELFEGIDDERVVEAAQGALTHRGDGVRLESMRLVLERRPDRIESLVREHRRDRNLEVQLLLAERWHGRQPDLAIEFLFEILEAERDGPRQGHALERGLEFLVEEASDAAVLERLRTMQSDFDDPEGFIAWGIEQMERRLA